MNGPLLATLLPPEGEWVTTPAPNALSWAFLGAIPLAGLFLSLFLRHPRH